MTTTKGPQFADISKWQDKNSINWSAYKTWAAQWDGISRILMRAGEGVGVVDSAFEQDWANAIKVGIDEIFVYVYAYPNLHPGVGGALSEAQSMEQIVGKRLRPRDKVMLDLEQNESSAWALAFGQELVKWHPTTSRPVLYDNLSHIRAFLTDARLPALFDLGLADWTFNPLIQPAAPAPWPRYIWLQFTDKLSIPGMPGLVDCNIWTGPGPVAPPPPAPTPDLGKVKTDLRAIISSATDALNILGG